MYPFHCRFGECGGRFGGPGLGWVGVFDSIALWILAIAAVLLVIRAFRGGRHWNNRQPAGGVSPAAGWAGRSAMPPHLAQAEGALAERYARGEISADEYQVRLAVMRGYPPPAPPAPGPSPEPPTSAGGPQVS